MKEKLSEPIKSDLLRLYNSQELPLDQDKNTALAVLKLSKNYQNELNDHSHIWSSKQLLKAYLFYFLPLNILRASAVLKEAIKHLSPNALQNIFDYGCGPGTVQLALKNNDLKFQHMTAFDKSIEALNLYKKWNKNKFVNYTSTLPDSVPQESLGIFSYSLNEIKSLPKTIFQHNHLLIIEPSNQAPARRLQGFRETFMNAGYNLLAPCTHKLRCPLLLHSKKDWCHHRILVEQPEWIDKISAHLPMKNTNLTYSYLILSKSTKSLYSSQQGRLIGDQQKEKGKSKQAFCRNEDREFLTWLKKDKYTPLFSRGDRLHLNSGYEKKNNELRINSKTDLDIV